VPVLLFSGTFEAFKIYIHIKYANTLNWLLLEIRIPKDIQKSPKAMEHVFAALHGVFIPPRWWQKLFQGKVLDWFSLEIVGIDGEPHFYIRTIDRNRKLVEVQIYAQFPDAEVIEVPDYVNNFPSSVPSDDYNMWGSEFSLTKEDAYPIRTYEDFEVKGGGLEEAKRIDPLASLSELISTLEAGEFIGVQLLITPTGDGWIKKGQAVVDKIMGKEVKFKGDWPSKIFFWIDSLIPGGQSSKKEEEKKPDIMRLSPGTVELLKSIEKSFGKLGFASTIRFLYLAPKEKFHMVHVSGIVGAYKQFASQSLNGFKLNLATASFARWPFKNQKIRTKKIILLRKFKDRVLGPTAKKTVLNTEELATVFHFPDVSVRSPLLPRIEAKKGEPPLKLPT